MNFKLGKVAGIDLFIHWTFSLLIVFIVYINYRTGYNANSFLVSSFRFMHFVTVVMHELGHAPLKTMEYKQETSHCFPLVV
jgi:Zn-dependent protease